MKTPKFFQWLFAKISDDSLENNIIGDIEELYIEKLKSSGRLNAFLCLLRHLFKSYPFFFADLINRRITMFMNYLKTALRNLMKYKGYSLINITGLAIGISCCILIFLYVDHELGYDEFHPDHNRVYRVNSHVKMGLSDMSFNAACDPLVPVLREQYPEIEDASRISRRLNVLMRHNDESNYEERLIIVEKNIMNILEFNMHEGDFECIFNDPGTIIVSEYISGKYFKEGSAIGNSISIEGKRYNIGGVVKNPPNNTHLKYNFILSFKNNNKSPDKMHNWANLSASAYIKLQSYVDGQKFAEKIRLIAHEYNDDYFKMKNWTYTTELLPVNDIHLYSTYREYEPKGNIIYVYSISIIGVLILVIACLNFVNLTTARASARTREVGMRKVAGAHRRQLICQFIGESLFLSLMSSIISIIIIYLSLPYFNILINRELSINDLFNPLIVSGMVLLILIIGFGAGSYPAFFLSAFKPLSILSGKTGSVRNSRSPLKKMIVIFQYAITVILITGTLVVFKQIDFMKNHFLGFDKEQKMTIPAGFRNNYLSIKDEFLKLPGVIEASASAGTLGRTAGSRTTRRTEDDADELIMDYIYFDSDFIPLYKIELTAGRNFDERISTDIEGAFIINETAARMLGFHNTEDAVGEYIEYGSRALHQRKEVIGVTKDFHYSDLQNKIAPLVMGFDPEYFRFLNLTVKTEKLTETVSSIKEKWTDQSLGEIFSYRFVDEFFDRFYVSEERVAKIFITFSFLAIFLSCLGLFSLSAFIAEQRTKEIGVRKTMGATLTGLIGLLTGDFLKWIIIANLIAIPLSYMIMDNWLQDFAYRISIGLEVYLVSFFIIFVISILTISIQTIKSALADPVKSLRYE